MAALPRTENPAGQTDKQPSSSIWVKVTRARPALVVLSACAVMGAVLHLGLYTRAADHWRLAPSLALRLWNSTVGGSDPFPSAQPLRSEPIATNSYTRRQSHLTAAPSSNRSRQDREQGRPTHNAQRLNLPPATSFTSPLIVTAEDWPLTNHLEPIPLESALGLPGDDTSATRPITVAYIRPCVDSPPNCFEEERRTYSEKCPYPGLTQTADLASADIVVFNVWRVNSHRNLPRFRRPPGQIWVMLSSEAPVRKRNHSQLDLPRLKGQFNLTMTYRLDSDIPMTYGFLRRRPKPAKRDFQAVYDAKRFHAAWLVSHCRTGSRRRQYVRELQSAGLTVHVYGLCGNFSCEGGERVVGREEGRSPNRVCMPRISSDYFFYLSFENSLCRDYVTEKMFKVYQAVDVIPVVRGGADYKKLYPPGTFVDAADFPDARQLARFLSRLAKDRERYVHMLREKWAWRNLPRPPWFCTLGEGLASGAKARVIPDVRAWYTAGQCHSPTDVG